MLILSIQHSQCYLCSNQMSTVDGECVFLSLGCKCDSKFTPLLLLYIVKRLVFTDVGCFTVVWIAMVLVFDVECLPFGLDSCGMPGHPGCILCAGRATDRPVNHQVGAWARCPSGEICPPSGVVV